MYKSGFAKQLSICSHTHNFTLCNYARLASIFIPVSWLLTIAAPGPQPHAHYSDISWDVLNKHVSLYNLIQPDDQIWLVDVIRFQNNQIWSSLRTFEDIRILHDGWSIPIWIFRWSLANWERAHQNWVEPFLDETRVRVRWLLGGIVQDDEYERARFGLRHLSTSGSTPGYGCSHSEQRPPEKSWLKQKVFAMEKKNQWKLIITHCHLTFGTLQILLKRNKF